ncbi:MAG: Pseudouridine synthase, RluA family [Parcubacteria group bacterium GW2011_GWA2_47_16]|nr:MAG: Pseudouridine synthase, RluA family [Parcubacteria group bacterium GW2011_GWA2_47_16]
MNLESIPILYEDKDVVVINKPAGLVVHSDGRSTSLTAGKTVEPTLVDWILEHYPETKGVGEPLKIDSRIKIQDSGAEKEEKSSDSIPESKILNRESILIDRPGVVHRLDRETSGVLVIAKNQKAFELLKKQFQEREMEKAYRAFVYGEVKNDEGVIDRPIARSTGDFRKWTAERGRRGAEREAVTEYKVLARHDGFSFLDVHPKTGRTHQIRVHLKAISHPVVCDKLYAPKRDCALGFSRLALHAFSLKFKLPTGKELTVEAPYPEDFKNALSEFSLNLKS